MNFNEAAEIAMRDTVQREINSKAYKAVDRAIDDATYGAMRWATYWEIRWATYMATRWAMYEALEEAQDEL